MDRSGLRVVQGRPAVVVAVADPEAFQAQCVQAYEASWVARGFSPVTIENEAGVLPRFLGLSAREAAEVAASILPRLEPARREWVRVWRPAGR